MTTSAQEPNTPQPVTGKREDSELVTCDCGEPLTIIEERERGVCIYCAYDYHNTDNPQRCRCDMCKTTVYREYTQP